MQKKAVWNLQAQEGKSKGKKAEKQLRKKCISNKRQKQNKS